MELPAVGLAGLGGKERAILALLASLVNSGQIDAYSPPPGNQPPVGRSLYAPLKQRALGLSSRPDGRRYRSVGVSKRVQKGRKGQTGQNW